MSVQPGVQPLPQASADVVLHAESAQVFLQRVPVERVWVRREVITEDVTVTVTVRREVLRLEREPLTERAEAAHGVSGVTASHAASGTAAGQVVLEVLLSTERPVVSLEVIPYERVRLGVSSVAASIPVTVDVRHEVADVITEPS